MPHVFVADVAAPELGDDDRHHLERVLRVRLGEEITVADGHGGWRRCVFGTGGSLEPVSEPEHRPRPEPEITIGFALTKGEKPELVVQKLTEIGVDRIIPFAAGRSIVRWDAARASQHVERLRRVAREAAMQSRRAYIADVSEISDFGAVAALPGAVLADAGGDPPSLDRPVVLIGPEGGWTDAERTDGPARCDLGPYVLRAETAAIVAGALLVGLRKGLIQHAGSLPEGL
jgi:16S rRNA (uracil1498-N3)-methyltransferase